MRHNIRRPGLGPNLADTLPLPEECFVQVFPVDALEVIHAVDVMVQGFLQLFPRHLDDLIGHVALHDPHKVLHFLSETQYSAAILC